MFKSLVRLDPEQPRRRRDSNPGSSALEADAFTTWPRGGKETEREREGERERGGEGGDVPVKKDGILQ